MRADVRATVAAALVLFAAGGARADTVTLVNGDRLTGRVIAKRDGRLVLRTEWAGELKIRWGDVAAVATDGPVALVIDGKVVRGTLGPATLSAAPETPAPGTPIAEPPREASLERADTGARERVALDRIDVVNPTHAEAGDGIDWSGRINASASLTRGNTDASRAYGEAELTGRTRDWRGTVGGRGNRASENSVQTVSNWLAFGNLDRFLDPKNFLYGRGSLESDLFRDINLRTAAGAGWGRQILDSDTTRLSAQTGVDYLSVDRPDGIREAYPSLGWGVNYSQWLFDRRLQLFHDQTGFWGFDDGNRVTVRTRQGLRMPVFRGVTLNAQLNVDWESRPAIGRTPADKVWIFGVGYAW
ncbi:MAG: DUF481 domain-containing protein [Burkholderiales bacterium]|nr:DUF481 domain-containing protein [Burkholderiales bacterium]